MLFPAVEGILAWKRMTAHGGKLQFIIMKDVCDGGVAARHADGGAPSRWEHAILSLAAGPQAVIIVDIGSPSPEAKHANKVIITMLLFTVVIFAPMFVFILLIISILIIKQS